MGQKYKKEKHVVVSEMRVLANLILRMTVVSLNDNLGAQNILEREHFDTLCDSIRHLTSWLKAEDRLRVKEIDKDCQRALYSN